VRWKRSRVRSPGRLSEGPKPIYTLTHTFMLMRTDISLPEDLVKRTRLASIEKYGNSRSMSKLIEEFIIKGLDEVEKQPDACSILGVRSDYSHRTENGFNVTVANISEKIKNMDDKISLKDLKKLDVNDYCSSTHEFFETKEAFELMLNEKADIINECYTCNGLDKPVPKYESAGKNFALWSSMCHNIR
jgi:metal-responsive CopG/Arc/MetJ family transcriptional regulator